MKENEQPTKKPPVEVVVIFIKPHEHAGFKYGVGDKLTVDADTQRIFKQFGVI